ncbi:copper chaperone [Fibrisoma montanum]|uniref:Copper chaperone n=1 Tax=Fibrisoma montanum TaxID=2305895 RepID=A0A418M2I8_9BACT|nr:copper chaperone [Fibrisoma montanum]RIV19931.1 copper chaperone [Fibrisoma montanum]
MKTLHFKTNLTDSEAIAAVTENLNAIEPIDGWVIDTESPDNLLSVQTIDNRIADQVSQAVARAGYRAEFVFEGSED